MSNPMSSDSYHYKHISYETYSMHFSDNTVNGIAR